MVDHRRTVGERDSRGNYLLTIEVQGKEQRLNLKVEDGKAKCVKASDPGLANVEGYIPERPVAGSTSST